MWHGAWLYGVYRMCQDGNSFMWPQPCNNSTVHTPLWCLFKPCSKKIQSLTWNPMTKVQWVCSRVETSAIQKSPSSSSLPLCVQLSVYMACYKCCLTWHLTLSLPKKLHSCCYPFYKLEESSCDQEMVLLNILFLLGWGEHPVNCWNSSRMSCRLVRNTLLWTSCMMS